jgi:predicted SprT family Zn-dependent metalloprotease
MGRLSPQLEFRWISWLRVRAAPPPSLPPQPPQQPPQKPPAHGRSGHADHALTTWCADTSRALNQPELAGRVRVSWNPRMQTTAGRAWWPDRLIELNPKLKALPPDETWCILRHELAHLIAYERAGRRHTDPHGPEWRAACAELGIPHERPCHNLPFERRHLERKHVYYCPHCREEVHRVRPLGRAVACYPCCRKHNRGTYDSRFRLLPKLP